MSIDYTALGTWTAIVAVVITLCTLIIEHRRSRLALSIDLTLKFEDRFNSEEYRRARKCAVRGLCEKAYEQADEALDFFETVGMLTRRHTLDSEMVWSSFSYWIYHYYFLAKDHIEAVRKMEPSVWIDLTYLYDLMIAVDRRKNSLSHYHRSPTEEALQEFIRFESNL